MKRSAPYRITIVYLEAEPMADEIIYRRSWLGAVLTVFWYRLIGKRVVMF